MTQKYRVQIWLEYDCGLAATEKQALSYYIALGVWPALWQARWQKRTKKEFAAFSDFNSLN